MRLRLTALYGALILASGAGLLVVTNILVRRATPVLPGGQRGTDLEVTRVPVGDLASAAAPHGGKLVGRTGGTVAEHSAVIHELLVQSAIALAIMTAVAIALGWLMAGRMLRPLHTMTSAVRQISAANLQRRLALHGPADELTALAGTFDDLLDRLDASFDAQRRFVANASHELRTPLTTIRTAVDVAAGKPQPPPEVVALAAKIRRCLDKTDQLLDGFLALSRAEHASVADASIVDLDWIAGGVLVERSDSISGQRLTVRTDLGAAAVRGDEVLLTQLAGNLLDNAIKHNKPGGSIYVATWTDGPHACLIVDSSGPVIDASEVQALTEPFRRRGHARTGPGHGLGLSIVAAVTAAHAGTLDLRARPGGGLSVSVTLPVAADMVGTRHGAPGQTAATSGDAPVLA